MRQKTVLPAKGVLENFFLLLKFTCPKHTMILKVPTSNLKDLLVRDVGPTTQGGSMHSRVGFDV